MLGNPLITTNLKLRLLVIILVRNTYPETNWFMISVFTEQVTHPEVLLGTNDH